MTVLTKTLVSVIRIVARAPLINALAERPSIRSRLERWPGFRRVYAPGWGRVHPFDRTFRTNTSGFVPVEHLPSSPFDSRKGSPYGGSQPSIIRAALRTLPALDDFTFVDLGCGKGRPLLVASEFAFRSIVGVELSSALANDAKRNASILARQFPSRVQVQVECDDASTYQMPQGNLVVFLYNPFGEDVMLKVIRQMEAALALAHRRMFVISYNPLAAHCFDASGVFKRFYAATLPYSEKERGYGPDETDTVIIWQAGSDAPPLPGADARVRITKPGVRAELELPRSWEGA